MKDRFTCPVSLTRNASVLVRTLLLGLALASIAGTAPAQPYPTKPLRLVVAFPAGGTADVVARTLAQALGAALGQNVIVENRAGGGTVIATELVARAAPDGHTLLYVSSSISLNPSIYKKLPYDTLRDLVPVTSVAAAVGFLMVAGPSLPVASVKELIALAKTSESKVNFGSPGYGNSLHVAGEVFKMRTGTQMLHVPDKGIGIALTAVMASEVSLAFMPPTIAVPQVKSGRVRALAFTGPARWGLMPEVPTLSETIPGFTIAAGWDGLFAPSRVSSETILKIQRAVRAALQDSKVREVLVAGGYDPVGSTPEEFQKFFLSEIKRYADIVRDAKIQPE